MSNECISVNNRFSIHLPVGWRDKSVCLLEGPVEKEFRHSIVVVVDHDVMPPVLIEYAETGIRAMEEVMMGYQELKRGKLTLDNQLPAYEIVFKWCPVDNINQYKRVVYVLVNETAFTFTATFTKKAWKIRGGEVDKIIKSICVPGFGFKITNQLI